MTTKNRIPKVKVYFECVECDGTGEDSNLTGTLCRYCNGSGHKLEYLALKEMLTLALITRGEE